jgi:prepilin-type N-terminal cleavage/methylation domain-containing protein
MNETQKGFTLIELLIVIGITAFLFAALIITLNPAELLRQARDSTRISDLANIRNAIAMYLADVSSPNLASSTGAYANCYTSATATTCGAAGFATVTVTSTQVANRRNNNATGWLPVNFTAISSGAPFGQLPLDPTNDASHYYGYAATSTNLSFKLTANGIESAKFGLNGSGDVVNNDGGQYNNIYEVGTLLSL